MSLVNPFEAEGKWFKANLHTHTTTSDGQATVGERIEQYRGAGYDILAITDHLVTNKVGGLSRDDFLVISGMETHPECPGTEEIYHLVGLNVPYGMSFGQGGEVDANSQIERIKKAGGEVIVAHPYWSGFNINDLLALQGYIAIEVYNAASTKIGKPFSSVHWDDLLEIGRVTGAVAVDDTHSGRDIFMGWTHIRARSLKLGAVMEALRRGSYYSSCGPVIEDFRIVDGKASVKCSPAAEIHFIAQRWHGQSFYADDWRLLTEAQAWVYNDWRYVRAEVVDEKGRRAWTNPIVLGGIV